MVLVWSHKYYLGAMQGRGQSGARMVLQILSRSDVGARLEWCSYGPTNTIQERCRGEVRMVLVWSHKYYLGAMQGRGQTGAQMVPQILSRSDVGARLEWCSYGPTNTIQERCRGEVRMVLVWSHKYYLGAMQGRGQNGARMVPQILSRSDVGARLEWCSYGPTNTIQERCRGEVRVVLVWPHKYYLGAMQGQGQNGAHMVPQILSRSDVGARLEWCSYGPTNTIQERCRGEVRVVLVWSHKYYLGAMQGRGQSGARMVPQILSRSDVGARLEWCSYGPTNTIQERCRSEVRMVLVWSHKYYLGAMYGRGQSGARMVPQILSRSNVGARLEWCSYGPTNTIQERCRGDIRVVLIWSHKYYLGAMQGRGQNGARMVPQILSRSDVGARLEWCSYGPTNTIQEQCRGEVRVVLVWSHKYYLGAMQGRYQSGARMVPQILSRSDVGARLEWCSYGPTNTIQERCRGEIRMVLKWSHKYYLGAMQGRGQNGAHMVPQILSRSDVGARLEWCSYGPTNTIQERCRGEVRVVLVWSHKYYLGAMQGRGQNGARMVPQILSRSDVGARLEWCSNGPTNTIQERCRGRVRMVLVWSHKYYLGAMQGRGQNGARMVPQILSRSDVGARLEWCSYGPTNTIQERCRGEVRVVLVWSHKYYLGAMQGRGQNGARMVPQILSRSDVGARLEWCSYGPTNTIQEQCRGEVRVVLVWSHKYYLGAMQGRYQSGAHMVPQILSRSDVGARLEWCSYGPTNTIQERCRGEIRMVLKWSHKYYLGAMQGQGQNGARMVPQILSRSDVGARLEWCSYGPTNTIQERCRGEVRVVLVWSHKYYLGAMQGRGQNGAHMIPQILSRSDVGARLEWCSYGPTNTIQERCRGEVRVVLVWSHKYYLGAMQGRGQSGAHMVPQILSRSDVGARLEWCSYGPTNTIQERCRGEVRVVLVWSHKYYLGAMQGRGQNGARMVPQILSRSDVGARLEWCSYGPTNTIQERCRGEVRVVLVWSHKYYLGAMQGRYQNGARMVPQILSRSDVGAILEWCSYGPTNTIQERCRGDIRMVLVWSHKYYLGAMQGRGQSGARMVPQILARSDVGAILEWCSYGPTNTIQERCRGEVRMVLVWSHKYYLGAMQGRGQNSVHMVPQILSRRDVGAILEWCSYGPTNTIQERCRGDIRMVLVWSHKYYLGAMQGRGQSGARMVPQILARSDVGAILEWCSYGPTNTIQERCRGEVRMVLVWSHKYQLGAMQGRYQNGARMVPQILSRSDVGARLEWCSYGPTNTIQERCRGEVRMVLVWSHKYYLGAMQGRYQNGARMVPQILSRSDVGAILEWCSYGPTNTIQERCRGDIRMVLVWSHKYYLGAMQGRYQNGARMVPQILSRSDVGARLEWCSNDPTNTIQERCRGEVRVVPYGPTNTIYEPYIDEVRMVLKWSHKYYLGAMQGRGQNGAHMVPQILSRSDVGARLEWCSNGPTNTIQERCRGEVRVVFMWSHKYYL